jgi:hypothetical protein
MYYENKVKLLLSDARGQYIPRDFVTIFDMKRWHLTEEDVEACLDPYNEWYWEQWYCIEYKARYTDDDGFSWTLHQDGDLYAVRDDMTEDDWEEWGI